MMRALLRPAVLAACVVAAGIARAACVAPGTWVEPARPDRPIEPAELIHRLAERRVVLLGEAHDSAEHHRWQLQVISGLHGQWPALALGFEAFPRRVQGALDRWVAGELSEAEFLAAADWRNVWGMDPQLYLPMFHFARMNRVPMIALNVEKETTRAVREKGFDAVDAAKREGLTRPAAPTQAYLDFLFPIFLEHEKEKVKDQKPNQQHPEFLRFVDSQTTWDRAMAQAIAETLAKKKGTVVVGIMGRYHARPYAVPHQLADLGVRETAVLLPWDRDARCDELVAGLADAVFGVSAPASAARRQRLGVRLEPAEGGVKITEVDKASIAEAAGLRAGDVVLEIAGQAAKRAGDVAEAVQRQAPGTWLPLRVKRGAETLDLVAKFAPRAE